MACIASSLQLGASPSRTYRTRSVYVSNKSCMTDRSQSPGQNNIATVPGLLGSSITSLEFVFKAIIDSEPWRRDPSLIPIPWRNKAQLGKQSGISFGFMASDGVVMPHPPIQRGLQMVLEALQADGHDIVSWSAPSHIEACQIHVSAISASSPSSDT